MFDRVGQRVSRIVQNCVVEAEVRPQILVKSLQIIERQELADAKVFSRFVRRLCHHARLHACARAWRTGGGGMQGSDSGEAQVRDAMQTPSQPKHRTVPRQVAKVDLSSARLRCWYLLSRSASPYPCPPLLPPRQGQEREMN